MRTRPVWIFVLLCMTLLSPTMARAGGDAADGHDHDQDGLGFFGFVKDTSGRTVRDAKVTADIKGLGSVVTRTDATGVYKLPGFGKDITANRVAIACSKDGYKHVRTMTRTPATKAPVTRMEVECTMQRIGAK